MSAPTRGEFQLIESHLSALGAAREDVVVGVGDDAALLTPAPATRLIVVCSGTGAQGAGDAEVAARCCAAEAFARLRAAGAVPAWMTVAMSLEDADEGWVARFAAALGDTCAAAGVSVIGGDTTSGRRAIARKLRVMSLLKTCAGRTRAA